MNKKVRESGVFYDKLGKVDETITLKVCTAGGGYVIYLPKTLCRIHDIRSGDKIKVNFQDHYRLKVEQ
jgi:hypothetical protein